MIREYVRIGHFGMVSLLFLIFLGLFTRTRRARAFSGGWWARAASDFARELGTHARDNHLN